MDRARVAVVRSGSARGSGYLLGGRLVLTAAHVLKDHGQVSVQLPGRRGRVACRVLWAHLEDGPQGWDAALLLADDDLSDRPLPAVRWGRLVTMQPCPAQAVGYPIAGQAGGDAVSCVQRDGRVLPASGRDRDRYVLAGDAGSEAQDGTSPWGGMSGAALWSGSMPGVPPLLTGVVAGDPPDWSHSRLEAVPAYVLASDPMVRGLVEEHTGRPMVLEPADLQHVTDRTAIPRLPRSPADLLRPEQAVVSFMGREELLTDLTHWCQPDAQAPSSTPAARVARIGAWDASPVQARLLTGTGGAGKTRLAVELAACMTRQGWAAIRLTTDTRVPLDLSQVCRPLLIVVDYAETRTPQLHALLEAVDHEQNTNPVRILALARGAGDWWTRATEHPHSQALATATVTPVPALHHLPHQRATGYAQALGDFSTRLRRIFPGTDWTALLTALTVQGGLPALSGAEFDNPLSVQMAALLSLLDATGIPQNNGSPTASLEGRLLGHERKYWDETARIPSRGLTGERSGSESRALAVALACLIPATDRDHARDLLAQLPGLAGDAAAAVRGALATWLADLYPTPDGAVWGSLQPDRIAEYHIGTQIGRESALFARILTTLPAAHATHALTVLARTAQHPDHYDTVGAILCDAITAAPQVLGPAALTTATRTQYPGSLVTALTHLTHTTDDIGVLRHLSDQLPESTLALSEWAADLSTALVDHHDTRDPDLPLLALALHNQSGRLAALGRREEALAASTRAVEIYQPLAEQHPGIFLPDFANALNNQSNHLAALGLGEEALKTITRAVEIYQALASQDPDTFLPRLAIALNNQSVRLALRRGEEALETITRAVEAYESLAEQHPDAFLPDFANALNNQSNHLAALGMGAEALEASTRAVEIREKLAKQHPDAFLPDLAMSLNNQSNRLAALGLGEEALKTNTRAVEIREKLAEQHPDAFLPDLADTLNSRCACLVILGRLKEAMEAGTRAVEILKNLADQYPDAFAEGLKGSLRLRDVLQQLLKE